MKAGQYSYIFHLPVIIIFLMFTGAAQSAIIHLSGNTVDFYYDNAVPGMAVYGDIVVVGDSIVATPVDLVAVATNENGSDLLASSFMVTAMVKPGYQFTSLSVEQEGSYQLIGAGAEVTTTGNLLVEDSINAATFATTTMTDSGTGLNDSNLNAWSAIGQFDLSIAAWNGVSSVDLGLNSLLTATTTSTSESAFINNRTTFIALATVVIPLPGAVTLFLSGLIGLTGLIALTRARRY